MKEIKIRDKSNFSQRISLENITYLLRITFNTRLRGWYLDLSDVNGEPIYQGIKITPQTNLTYRFIKDDAPSGDFVCIRVTNTEQPLDRDNFGFDKDYSLVYFTQDELEQLGVPDRKR